MYELIVAEAAEAVGQGVVTRLNDAVATSQLGTNFIQTGIYMPFLCMLRRLPLNILPCPGFLSLDQYGDAFMVALLVGHPLFSAVVGYRSYFVRILHQITFDFAVLWLEYHW